MANKTWDKIISSPDVTGEKGTIGAAESRHMAEYTPKKLAASELKKGLKGDWQKEGYRLDHWQDRQGYHNVAAYDKNNNVVGTASFTDHLVPNELGTNLVSHPDYMKGWSVEVHPDHRRLGLASAMYQYAEKMSGKKILQGGTTSEGSSLWGQKNRKFGNLNIHDKINLKTLQRSEDGNLKKAPVEYITDPQETHKKIAALNETYPLINKVNLPNGLVYQQHTKNDYMGPVHVHHLYHPNEKNPIAEVITRPDPDNEMNHKVSYSQVSPDHKGKGLGKQAYLAALIHGKGVGRLLSDNELSRNAHKMWTSLKGVSGLGGKIGSYVTHKMYDKGVSPAKYAQAHQDQHQVFVKNKKALDHNALFPSVDIGDGVKETKLAASEDLNKSKTFKTSIQSVPPNIGLERLKQIKQDHYVGAGGKDYDPDELHQRMFEIGEKQAAKQSLFPEQESEKTRGSFEQMAPPMPGKKMFGKSDELISLLTKGSARLEKMSRPRITFPKMGLDTRPDQNVQLLEEPRQVKLFGRKVADQQIKDFENKKGIKLKPVNREREMKRLSGKTERRFGNNALGLNYSLEDRDIPAALAGKARSKHEAPDEGHVQKVKENTEKYNEAKLKYYDDMDRWRKEAEQFPSGSTAYYNHIANRPEMPSKPRKPAKKKVETKNLTPEQMKSRGQAIDSTVEHEALHSTLGQIERKFGPVVYSEVKDKLLGHYKPDTLNAVANWVEGARGYKRSGAHFKDEILTHARDLLVNADKRKSFKDYLKKVIGINHENYYNEHMKNLKQGHQKSYEWAQNLTPERLTSSVPSYGQLKVAADKDKK